MSLPTIHRAPVRALLFVLPLVVGGAVLAASMPWSPSSVAGVTVVTPAELVPARGFEFELTVDVPLAPPAAYDAFANDLAQWWDHTLSGDQSALSFDARPAGGFVERFAQVGDAGANDGARHATVTLAQRGQRLVFLGQLGLVGKPFLGVHDLSFTAVDGDPTRTHVTLVASGFGLLDDGLETVVQSVWTHFLTAYATHAAGM